MPVDLDLLLARAQSALHLEVEIFVLFFKIRNEKLLVNSDTEQEHFTALG